MAMVGVGGGGAIASSLISGRAIAAPMGWASRRSSSVSVSASASASAAASTSTSTSVRQLDEAEFRTTPAELQAVVDVPLHTVTVRDRLRGVVHQFQVPEDQYILHTAEYQDITLPFSCRHGCCTACAVRVKSGEIYQPQALGISPELKQQGYALLCVGYPLTDLEVETQDEDEVYWLQFGRYFARGPVERDDYALELAMGDE